MKLEAFDMRVPLSSTESGHPILRLQQLPEEDKRTGETIQEIFLAVDFTNGTRREQKAGMTRLHRQFGQNRRNTERPAVAMPMAEIFNKKVAKYLKIIRRRNIIILHIIDMWSRPRDVIDALCKHWVAHYGIPGGG